MIKKLYENKSIVVVKAKIYILARDEESYAYSQLEQAAKTSGENLASLTLEMINQHSIKFLDFPEEFKETIPGGGNNFIVITESGPGSTGCIAATMLPNNVVYPFRYVSIERRRIICFTRDGSPFTHEQIKEINETAVASITQEMENLEACYAKITNAYGDEDYYFNDHSALVTAEPESVAIISLATDDPKVVKAYYDSIIQQAFGEFFDDNNDDSDDDNN